MPPRFIDRFDTLLLDMGETFMYDADRFAPEHDIAGTYRRLGGGHLSDADVRRMTETLLDVSMRIGRDPTRFEDYPTVPEFLAMLPETAGLPQDELDRLEEVFLIHEMGRIPPTHAGALHELRRTHRLGLVSNITSRSAPFHETLAAAGVRELFDVLVFSSDYRAIKPSPVLFRAAMDAFDTDPSRLAYVGDNQMRDVGGAKAVGLAAVWIAADGREPDPALPAPDLVIRDLRELLSAEA